MLDTSAPMRLGDLIDAMYGLRENKRLLEAELKVINEQLDTYDHLIQAKLDEAGTTMAKGLLGSASISEQKVYQIDSSAEFFAYVADNQAWHLVQRRPASNAIRELEAMGEEVPGITSFTKRSISLRKI
jgi:hypothetical protein